MIKHASNQRGFTIIELMISTAVFSVVLLVVTLGILDINRTYYKGLANSKTQEVARAIIQDVSQAVQFNGGKISNSIIPGIRCVGERQYSFVLFQKVTDNPEVHGLIARTGSDCPSGPNMVLGSGETELLGENMRLSKFEVRSVNNTPGLYRVTVRVVYGDDDLIDNLGFPGGGNTCKSQRAGSQFCAVSELSTVVQQRVR